LKRNREKNEKKKVRIIHQIGSKSVELSQVISYNLPQNYSRSLNEINLTCEMLYEERIRKRWGMFKGKILLPTNQEKKR